MFIEVETEDEGDEGEPPLPIPAYALARLPELDPFMAEQREQLSQKRKKEQVITTLMLLAWLQEEFQVPPLINANQLAALYKVNLQAAFEESDRILQIIKHNFAKPAEAIGVYEPVFIFMNLTDDKTTAKQKLLHYFQIVFTLLGITDTHEQDSLFFSGLGIEHLRLCLVAYKKDKDPAFLRHEWKHIQFPGLNQNAFFDEVITEILAYHESGYFDLDQMRLTKTKSQLEDEERVNTIYYDHIELFCWLTEIFPTLFPLLRAMYEGNIPEDMERVKKLIGEKFYKAVSLANPEEYDPALGTHQIWKTPAETLALLSDPEFLLNVRNEG